MLMRARRDLTMAEAARGEGGARLDHLLVADMVEPGSRVLDVGCGKGTMLIRVCERWSARGLGVDINPVFLAEARRRAESRVPGAIEFVESPMRDVILPPQSFAAALCVGASHALDGFRGALVALRERVEPGGRLLVGEGYWKREPDDDYLAALGATRDELHTHDGNVATIRALGFEPLEWWRASDADWDAYESLYRENVERHCAAHPDDPDREEMLARSRSGWETYERWGRDTMGFALYALGA